MMVCADPVYEESSIDITTNPEVQQLSLKSIHTATGHFKTLIGEGGFGSVYQGTLAHGQQVAVKVRSPSSTQGTREFNNEVGGTMPVLPYMYRDRGSTLLSFDIRSIDQVAFLALSQQ